MPKLPAPKVPAPKVPPPSVPSPKAPQSHAPSTSRKGTPGNPRINTDVAEPPQGTRKDCPKPRPRPRAAIPNPGPDEQVPPPLRKQAPPPPQSQVPPPVQNTSKRPRETAEGEDSASRASKRTRTADSPVGPKTAEVEESVSGAEPGQRQQK
ncbi:hypothetical protein BJ138DRAFT_1121027 [Hygrophoropsis aurantiaca]|uniref:Uncharacterized protein n=1 Tax=Hygrophoropsis aurantiaca TaxID=72124 RepID=A0ACB7ZP37_9AGAM|nr:hypothetical protein BJ138DRAFT_1121027 [Hygrophoropsis aurantiaca]